MDKAKLIGIAPKLMVKDVKNTSEYFRDVLGFRIIGFFLEPPVYAMVERDGFQIHLAKSESNSMNEGNEYNEKADYDFIIWVPEIDKFFEEVKSGKADITEGIVKRVYGNREFVIRDCDGHKILVAD